MDQNTATIPVITFDDADASVKVAKIVNGILSREMMPIDVVRTLFCINTDDGEISAMDLTSAMYKRAQDKSKELQAFCLDKSKLGLIGQFVFKGETWNVVVDVMKFVTDDEDKLHTICLKLSISAKDNAFYKLVSAAVLVAYNSRVFSFDEDYIEFDERFDGEIPPAPAPSEEATPAGGSEQDQPAAEQPKAEEPKPTAEPPKKVESADIHDPKIQENLLRGLFKTSMPAITHITNFLKDFHEKNKTPSFLASMETVPTETTIVWTDPPYDFTVSIMKMKEGRFYRMHLAKTDLTLEFHEYSRTRNVEGRWVQLGRDVQNTMLNQPQYGGYRRRY